MNIRKISLMVRVFFRFFLIKKTEAALDPALESGPFRLEVGRLAYRGGTFPLRRCEMCV
jgi:hypothetical protein